MPTLEDNLQSIQRRRVAADLELIPEITLTDDQNAALDALCGLCPLIDEPNLVAKIVDINRPAAVSLMKQLPTTHPITRILEGRWPQ